MIPTAVAGLQEDAPDFRIVDAEEMGESEPEPMSTADAPITGKKALDTAEFAAFLARKR